MEVNLVDPSTDSSFQIRRVNMDAQIIDSLGYTEWDFSVRPIKYGDKSLNLVISVITDEGKKQKVYSDTIHIKADIKKEVGSFWSRYWQWLFTTFLIPVFVYLWKRKKKDE
jgi:hypothetical protein